MGFVEKSRGRIIFFLALLGGIATFFGLFIQIIIMAPVFFTVGDALNETATTMLDPSILPNWTSTFNLGRNVFWGIAFIVLVGSMIYVYMWASRKEYAVAFR